jgi:hypothetical protein
MNPIAAEFLSRIKDTTARQSAMGRLSDWLVKNTTLHGKPYNFHNHEFQRDLLDDTYPDIAVIKPSQVGLSETTARMVIGFLAVQSDTRALYLLPTAHEAIRFVKDRIDPVIESSPYVKTIMNAGSDSSSFKRIGSSSFYAMGTSRDLISLACDMVISDETDSSNLQVLKSVDSRLQHSRFKHEETGVRGYRRWLSTPSVSGIGIDALYQQSDKRKRLVKCKHCAEWFYPEFFNHVVVDGFDNNLSSITAEDIMVLEDRGLLETARLLCPNCHNVVTQANLGHQYREWVAENPSITLRHGYMVSPFDVPEYLNPMSLLRKRSFYGNEESQFYNYSLGLPYDSSSNSISGESVRQNTTLEPVFPGNPVYGTVLGLDVGKTSWITISKPVRINGIAELHVLWAEQVRVEDDNLYATVVERMKQFQVVRAVVDSAPYFDTILRIQAAFPEGVVLPCTYTLTDRKLPSYLVNDNTWTVSANRTKCFDLLAKNINSGKVKFARFPEINTFTTHLQNIKRVERREDGELVDASWVKSGAEHWAHSLGYSAIAAQMIDAGEYINFAPLPSIREAFVGKKHTQEKQWQQK